MIRGDRVENPHLWIPVLESPLVICAPDGTELCALCGLDAKSLGHADLSGEEFGMLFVENQVQLSLGQTWRASDGEKACIVGSTATQQLVIVVGPVLYEGGLQLVRQEDFRERYKSLCVIRFADRRGEL